MKKKVIGIVLKHYLKDQERLDTVSHDEIEQAIFDNDAIAIGIIPANTGKERATNDWVEHLTDKEKEDFIYQINMCDGIILQGGAFSDMYECFIAKYCFDNDIPILGICAGSHNMVRAVGGKVQDVDNPEFHHSQETYVHDITINKDSTLYKIIKKEKIKVNSRHENAAKELGPLSVCALSDDNVIESVESKDKKFYLAVQFHPESLYKIDENMNNIFKYFINICDNK